MFRLHCSNRVHSESRAPCEVLVSCCDHVCSVRARAPPRPVPPPPRHAPRARRPSAWDLREYSTVSPRAVVHKSPPSPRLLTPIAPDRSPPRSSPQSLDELLEKAGLQGILEKDFLLMRGLKNDLNRKLHEMETNMETNSKRGAASQLSLVSCSPTPPPRPDTRRARRHRFCPESSMNTPSGSEHSSPRNYKLKL